MRAIHDEASPGQPEKLYTFQEAADILKIYAWKIRRAVKKGLIPSYTLLNSRRLVRLSEVIAAMNAGDRP
jgi:excisionase family DNA binding protein